MGLSNAIDQQQDQSYDDLLAKALGTQFQTFRPILANFAAINETGDRRGTSLWATSGALITGIKMRNTVAASGTGPTTVRGALLDNTGKVLALTANLNAAATWPTGALSFPFTSPLTLTYSGVYYPSLICTGAWATTQPAALLVTVSGSGPGLAADGSNPPPNYNQAAQTDFPAVGSSVTISTPSSSSYWFGLY